MSAALIVRDESAFIEDCLLSLVGNVDEIVLVDTGSQDDTVAIAQRYPIKLHHFEWRDDFSAARNFAIDHASGDWILYIDADERLTIPARDEYERVLADRGKVAWEVRFHPRVGWTPYCELRLFRNDPRIRFRGVIHESVRPDIDTVARADQLAIGRCNLVLRHVGYETDQKPKNARNIPLLQSYLSREPDRIYCWWHLGECLLLAGDHAAAIDAWTRGIEVLRRTSQHQVTPGDGVIFLSLLKLKHDRGEDIETPCAEAIALFPENLALQWIAAQLAVLRDDHDVARPVLEKLQSIDPETFFDPELAYDKALFRHHSAGSLALCHFRSKRYREAAHWYRIAARTAPEPTEYELKARLAEIRASG